MSKIPPHSGKESIAAFLRAGFTVDRTTGDHFILVKQGLSRPITIPLVKELADFVVSNNIRTAGLNRKKYLWCLRGKKLEDYGKHGKD